MAKASKAIPKQIPLDLIDEPSGVIRLEINEDEIKELADNIKEVGLVYPITVRPHGERFEIVDGHRRYLSFELLARKKIPCVIRDLEDVDVAVIRASANLRSVGHSLIEEAAIYADLRDNHKLTADQIGKLLGVSPGVVKRRLDLLKMPPDLQKAIHTKQISYGVAEELWRLGDPGVINYYLGFAVEHGCTVAVARQWVSDERKKARTQDSDIEGSGRVASPMEPRPVWVTCDLCLGPMELGKEITMRCCEKCTTLVKKALMAD